mgnify:CR=1 FL=1
MPSFPTSDEPICSICGDAVDAAVTGRIANPVCRRCDRRATTADGTPAAEVFDPNPVFIDGHKCWRKYSISPRAAGPNDPADQFYDHLTMRDAVDCTDLEECIRRHTDPAGDPREWFVAGPTGKPIQIRAEPDSGADLEAFFAQFDSSTAFRIHGTETTVSVEAEKPVVGPTKLPPAAVGLTEPPTYELTTVESSPRTIRLALPDIEVIETVSHDSLPSLDDGVLEERVDRYRQLAAAAPGVVPAESLWPLIDVADTEIRYDVIRTVSAVIEDRPAVGLTAVDQLVDRLDDERTIRLYAVRSLATVAEQHPEAVVELAPEIIEELTHKNSLLNAAATQFLLAVAEHKPAAALDATPAIASLLSKTPTRARRQALSVLCVIAEAFPEEVRPLVPQLCSLLDADDDPYRISCTAALGHVTSAYPDAATPVVPTLLDELTAYDPELRGNSVGILGDIAQEFPMDVAPYTEEIAPLLDDSDPTVRSNTAGTLARVAAEYPERVDPHIPQLIELLDDSWTRSRVHACWVLGHCRATEATEPLRKRRREDSSEAVRSRAAWALDRIN